MLIVSIRRMGHVRALGWAMSEPQDGSCPFDKPNRWCRLRYAVIPSCVAPVSRRIYHLRLLGNAVLVRRSTLSVHMMAKVW
jgi:hypothetical protein